MTTSPGDQQPAVTVRSRPIPKVLVGQKALVTGANSGIGRAVALGQAGADVVVNYVNNAGLQGWGVCGQRSASRDRAA
jgi:glucose 1-dehydrogenase